jgi:hypothetical protein
MKERDPLFPSSKRATPGGLPLYTGKGRFRASLYLAHLGGGDGERGKKGVFVPFTDKPRRG